MVTENRPRARRVITGTDGGGKSAITSDEPTSSWVERAGGATVMEIWRAEALPARIEGQGTLPGGGVPDPPPQGLAIRVCTFPPEGEVDPGLGREGEIPGMHSTETVDVVTVISGELFVVTETGDTLLRPGDSVVQRGTRHAWRNRSDQTAVVVAVMMAGER